MQAIRKSLRNRSLELVKTSNWDNCLHLAAEDLKVSPVTI